MKNNQIITLVLVAIVFAGGGFFGGMQYQKNQPPAFNRTGFAGRTGGFQGGNQPAGGMAGGARRGNGQVIGEITSQDDKSVTVKTLDGGSKIILLSATTSINKSASGTTADLKVGEKVAIFGNTNTDGSVTAQNIQLNPVIRGLATPSAAPTK